MQGSLWNASLNLMTANVLKDNPDPNQCRACKSQFRNLFHFFFLVDAPAASVAPALSREQDRGA